MYGSPHEQFFYVNNWKTQLTAAILATDTLLPIEGPYVDLLDTPAPSSTRRYLATLDDGAGTVEVIEIRGRNTTNDTITVDRGREGTPAAAFAAGTTVEMRITARTASILGAAFVDQQNNLVAGPTGAGKALTTGYGSVILGQGAGLSLTTGYESVAVGSGALQSESTGFRNTALGYNAMGSAGPNSQHNVAVGYNAGSLIGAAQRATLLGAYTDFNAGGYADVVCLGYGAVAKASNQGVIGSNNSPITDIYIGEGVDSSSPPALVTLNATGGGGTNVPGAPMRIAGGKGTGTGQGGKVLIATAPAGPSGTAQNALVERAEWDANGLFHTYADIKTGDIGATAAPPWKLGTFQTGAVSLDAANYIEIEIAGTPRKLLVAA